MRLIPHGAQRASIQQLVRSTAMAAAVAGLALGGSLAVPATTAAASVKVVIVVGPVGSQTANYISNARRYAAQARAYGAAVTEIYSPNATWSRVRSAAAGANIFIYLGHGNGYPSPYGPFSAYKVDGLGLNAAAGHGNANVKYYGEYYLRTGLRLDRDAVVILNRLCYASGNSEWGSANPSLTTAKQRADNFGAGFLRTGARAVFANGIDSITPILYSLLRTNRTIAQIFESDPAWTGTRDVRFASKRTSGATVWMDPYATSRYYHSVVGNLSLASGAVRAGS